MLGATGFTFDIAAWMVVAPMTWLPLPCQEMVHPPIWLFKLLAPLPVTKTLAVFARGRTLPVFCSTTIDSATALRAIMRCAAEPTVVGSPRLKVERPAWHLTFKMRVT